MQYSDSSSGQQDDKYFKKGIQPIQRGGSHIFGDISSSSSDSLESDNSIASHNYNSQQQSSHKEQKQEKKDNIEFKEPHIENQKFQIKDLNKNSLNNMNEILQQIPLLDKQISIDMQNYLKGQPDQQKMEELIQNLPQQEEPQLEPRKTQVHHEGDYFVGHGVLIGGGQSENNNDDQLNRGIIEEVHESPQPQSQKSFNLQKQLKQSEQNQGISIQSMQKLRYEIVQSISSGISNQISQIRQQQNERTEHLALQLKLAVKQEMNQKLKDNQQIVQKELMDIKEISKANIGNMNELQSRVENIEQSIHKIERNQEQGNERIAQLQKKMESIDKKMDRIIELLSKDK